MKEQAVAIIPARGGSKRIPEKNIRSFAGRVLIAYSIEAALETKLFCRVIVSTDCAKIAEVAQASGAEVPFMRSAEISDDMTPVSAVTADALKKLDPDGSRYKYVAQLMPNCPLRTSQDVIASYRQFLKTGADTQISIVRYGWQTPWWALRRDANTFMLQPLFAREMTARSQDLPELFCPTGAIWWGKSSVVREQRTFHIPQCTGWEIAWEHGIDIDTFDDLALAEAVLRKGEDHH
jgi:CMP-N-acetylneuraminic acid synthetase